MPGLVALPAKATTASSTAEFIEAIITLLQATRNLDGVILRQVSEALHSQPRSQDGDIPGTLSTLISALQTSAPSDANAIALALEKTTDSPSHGGLGITSPSTSTSTSPSTSDEYTTPATPAQYEDVLFLLSAHLTALNNAQVSFNATLPTAHAQTQPMTLTQKIFAAHSLSPLSLTGLQTGSVLLVGLDWVLASELSWSAMARTHTELGSPGIWRNDRFWLAGDHVVHPQARGNAKVEAMVDAAEKAKRAFRMTDFQGMNYTIMHTEFVRERAEPGMLCVGSDSHTCSGGAVGCLSIGLGAADSMMALALGRTWFKVPETICIVFVGKPGRGVSGKDVILQILRELKRNTVAAERVVEFTGEGCRYLSVDARFAICNMCTEFGAITGVFVPDEVTRSYVAKRRRKANRTNSVYFRPDEGAVYAGEYTIDLSKVEPTIAVYPEPDHVVPVSEKAGMKVDGVFIGACTTTEEEIVLGGLVLKAGLKKGLPLAKGKRHYVPGSLPIVDRLNQLGLLKVYEEAGFTRGPPGCSYCVGLSAEKASEGETWLSSQNRNFKNRMGPGAFGNLSSAVVCAASSFSLTITDPTPFLAELDWAWFDNVYRRTATPPSSPSTTQQRSYVEPDLRAPASRAASAGSELTKPTTVPEPMGTITSTIITLGDMIDTDALSPGHTLVNCVTNEDFGAHCLERTHPDFRSTVKSYPGSSAVVVAGHAFGVGSSRETAVSALKGCGVRCVIARSFAFILGRNMPSLGLLGITMDDEGFYAAAGDGQAIEVDVPKRVVRVEVEGEWREWPFVLSDMEYQLTLNEGVSKSFQRYGKGIWEGLMQNGGQQQQKTLDEAALLGDVPADGPRNKMDW